MPNTLAFLMLAIWPLVTLLLFVKLPPGRALLATIISAYLILPPAPTALDFPLLPPLNKETLPLVSAFLLYLYVTSRKQVPLTLAELVRDLIAAIVTLPLVAWNVLRASRTLLNPPDNPLGKLFLAMFVFGPVATVLINPEPLIFQMTAIRGLYLFDAIALSITQFLLLIGYLLARKFLQTTDDQRDLFAALMIGGLAYALPIMIEVRLSPQINIWVYGYFQHLFDQTIRAGGFRPIVFLNHGIWVAFFMLMALISTVALTKAKPPGSRLYLFITSLFFLALLVLSKTLASLLFALLLMPLIWLLSARKQIAVALVMGIAAFSYPALKSVDAVPAEFLLERAAAVSKERAYSLQFRFENEDMLFERAEEKPLFGWGSWGRNQIRNPVNGQIESVSDGRWIITIGIFGWVGFLAEFGLLLLPILLIWRETRFLKPPEISPYIGPLALLLGANMVDLIPNATLTPLTWLIAGALLGHAEMLRRRRVKQKDTSKSRSKTAPSGMRPIL